MKRKLGTLRRKTRRNRNKNKTRKSKRINMKGGVDYSKTILNLSKKGLTELPADLLKYTNLQILNCSNNKLEVLPELPASLEILYCFENKLEELPELPASLQELYCEKNQLTKLPELPASLQELECSNNPLKNVGFKITIKNREKYNQWLEDRQMENPVFK